MDRGVPGLGQHQVDVMVAWLARIAGGAPRAGHRLRPEPWKWTRLLSQLLGFGATEAATRFADVGVTAVGWCSCCAVGFLSSCSTSCDYSTCCSCSVSCRCSPACGPCGVSMLIRSTCPVRAPFAAGAASNICSPSRCYRVEIKSSPSRYTSLTSYPCCIYSNFQLPWAARELA